MMNHPTTALHCKTQHSTAHLSTPHHYTSHRRPLLPSTATSPPWLDTATAACPYTTQHPPPLHADTDLCYVPTSRIYMPLAITRRSQPLSYDPSIDSFCRFVPNHRCSEPLDTSHCRSLSLRWIPANAAFSRYPSAHRCSQLLRHDLIRPSILSVTSLRIHTAALSRWVLDTVALCRYVAILATTHVTTTAQHCPAHSSTALHTAAHSCCTAQPCTTQHCTPQRIPPSQFTPFAHGLPVPTTHQHPSTITFQQTP